MGEQPFQHWYNKKSFIEQQISISEWFLKDNVTLKTEAMAAENSDLL